ncbi:MmcQ/YjbR family DNA-binding protein [Paraburkholderia caribensis]|uniref:MmcQ/YjbR family DNA-binding protein n=1 Tax=Paraburkholderia caribensis TaxID=75105 RepID=A0A9Q6S6J6_9BURK|nr:hypothetical protein [Paraburkholderia caribensis]MCO4880108.1 MmcQ/YjbR family DNA-binding protein [Paraburkholderia caribensis]PTB26269.1 hypothetical protein C9I56_24080 [Paraburkholderia caribensis]QLB66112.1 hypothetical protein A9O66_27975 [Paraburkholderia caribensis]
MKGSEVCPISRADHLKCAKTQYGTKPDYPQSTFPSYAVLRHADNEKWYGLVMNVPRSRLGQLGDGEIDIIDLKSDPAVTVAVRQSPRFLPACHMMALFPRE